MSTSALSDREHEPYPWERGEPRLWCRTCTNFYDVLIVYPCMHADRGGASDRDVSPELGSAGPGSDAGGEK